MSDNENTEATEANVTPEVDEIEKVVADIGATLDRNAQAYAASQSLGVWERCILNIANTTVGKGNAVNAERIAYGVESNADWAKRIASFGGVGSSGPTITRNRLTWKQLLEDPRFVEFKGTLRPDGNHLSDADGNDTGLDEPLDDFIARFLEMFDSPQHASEEHARYRKLTGYETPDADAKKGETRADVQTAFAKRLADIHAKEAAKAAGITTTRPRKTADEKAADKAETERKEALGLSPSVDEVLRGRVAVSEKIMGGHDWNARVENRVQDVQKNATCLLGVVETAGKLAVEIKNVDDLDGVVAELTEARNNIDALLETYAELRAKLESAAPPEDYFDNPEDVPPVLLTDDDILVGEPELV